MKVLFIGGTGLISTAIARQLLEQGHDVTLFNRGQSENRVPEGAKIIHGDRKDYAAFERQFAALNFDVVVDMVAFVPDDTSSAIRAFQGRVGQLIHCSTVCVYSGPCAQIPTGETEPYHSIGSYGRNKIECEKLLFQAHADDDFPATIMRPSHSYGEGGSVLRAIGPADGWLTRLRRDKPIVIHGDGTSLWGSCHVDDVARGFIATMNNTKTIGQAYNIAGDEWMMWSDYHSQVAEVLGAQIELVPIPTATLHQIAPDWAGSTFELFQWHSIFDSSKLKRDTDYKGQTISWREGVRRNIEWLERDGPLTVNQADDEYEDRLISAWHAAEESLPQHS